MAKARHISGPKRGLATGILLPTVEGSPTTLSQRGLREAEVLPDL